MVSASNPGLKTENAKRPESGLQIGLKTTERAGELFVERLRKATDWAQAAIATAQDRQQTQANRNRQAAPIYEPGGKVWLNLKNTQSERPSKKLRWLHARYEVIEVPSPHTVRLNVPSVVHPTFHVDLVRPAASDPLPSQIVDDTQPPPILGDNEAEWEVEEIIATRTRTFGRGSRREVLGKWRGYAERTWQDVRMLEKCAALDEFEERFGNVQTNDGPCDLYETRTRRCDQVRAGALRTLLKKEVGKGGIVTGQCLVEGHVRARDRLPPTASFSC